MVGVAGDQLAIEAFGNGDVGGVLGSDVVAQFPSVSNPHRAAAVGIRLDLTNV
jgi:hypothetical protein